VSELLEDLELARAAVRRAGEAVMEHFRQTADVRYKSPDQPVTEADLAADRLLRSQLLEARPGYGWLSEETADSPERLSRQRVWVVDPIDGTRSFIDGRAEFAICVGLAEDGAGVLGVVYNPATDELHHAARGEGAFRNGVPIRVRDRTGDDGPGTLVASRSEIRRGDFDALRDRWHVTPLGSTAYKMMKVADGSAQAFLSRGPKSEWDVCGAAVIVEEAGGRVTRLDGADLHFNRAETGMQGVVATNSAAHPAILREIAGLPPRTYNQEGEG
jgi:myo-inositol-1(or 4)-monophosphatase